MPYTETRHGQRFTYVQRCKRQNDQCNRRDEPPAECHKVEDRHAWRCEKCGREYTHDQAFAYREEIAWEWVA